LNGLLSRSAKHGEELIGWTDRFMRIAKLKETPDEKRLRHAACLLSDIGWRVHPDYRGEQTLNLITNGNFGAVGHHDRAFLALSVFYRYAGLAEQNEPPAQIRALVTPAQIERAKILGAAFRVAHLISAAQPGVLSATNFSVQDRKLNLIFEHRMVDLVADRVASRFKQLARLVGKTGTIVRR
jgi:exopolyphosphatase/guanosine-5'-triphosphate,3'-diphosphate pyrophosphatase